MGRPSSIHVEVDSDDNVIPPDDVTHSPPYSRTKRRRTEMTEERTWEELQEDGWGDAGWEQEDDDWEQSPEFQGGPDWGELEGSGDVSDSESASE